MPYDDYSAEYESAPDRPTSPITAPFSEAQARAVALALKATGLPAGAASAAGAAGILISEVRHHGYEIRPASGPLTCPDDYGDMFVIGAEDCDHFEVACRPCRLTFSLQHGCPDPAHPVHNQAPIASVLRIINRHLADPEHLSRAADRVYPWRPASADPS